MKSFRIKRRDARIDFRDCRCLQLISEIASDHRGCTAQRIDRVGDR
jgi:hypothetical protein